MIAPATPVRGPYNQIQLRLVEQHFLLRGWNADSVGDFLDQNGQKSFVG